MNTCTALISEYTGHEHVLFTKRANKSILLAMKVAKASSPGKSSIIIPDQGGWLTYKQSPKKIKLAINEVRTDYGVIDLADLDRLVSLGNVTSFIYTNPAGYYANQPIKDIHETCKDRCIVILDASGCLGSKKMCDGTFADIAVGSFGKWKPVNAGKGGFISFKTKEMFDLAKELYDNDHGLIEKDFEEIAQKLKEAPDRIKHMQERSEKIKKDLAEFEIIHPDLTGLNVVVRFKNGKDKEQIIKYCESEDIEYTECPRYIRVNENAISIEVKRY